MTIASLTPETRAARGRLWRAELDDLPVRVAQCALEHLSRWSVPLSPSPLILPARPAETGLAWTLGDLLSYARTGRASDWSGPSEARDALLSIALLYDAPLSGESVPADWIDGEHEGLRGEVAEVARAAWARVHVAEGLPVPRQWLAALAGVSRALIVKLVGQGAFELEPARGGKRGTPARDVTGASARAWLRGRGVEGL